MESWEQRMGAKARARRQAQEEAETKVRVAAWLEEVERERAAFMLREPNPCQTCYRDGLFGNRWYWAHIWPEEQRGALEWTCRHECHGPEGEVQYAVAYATTSAASTAEPDA